MTSCTGDVSRSARALYIADAETIAAGRELRQLCRKSVKEKQENVKDGKSKYGSPLPSVREIQHNFARQSETRFSFFLFLSAGV